MARNSLFKNSKSKLILVLFLVASLCFSLFAVACNDDSKNSSSDVPSYTYNEVDEHEISNRNFTIGTNGLDNSSFPKTTINGWNKTKDSDSNIILASAFSGAVNVKTDAWNELYEVIYNDSSLMNYALYVNGIDINDVKSAMKEDTDYNKNNSSSYTPTDKEVKEYVIENYIKDKFANPGAHADAEDNVVYMLNNYRSKANLGLGTSQKITSSSEITLEKGSYAKLTAWVKTANLSAKNSDFGANIRLMSSFNGTDQADYVIKNIKATDWTQYTIYVQADENFDTTIQLVLGLGYGVDGITEGTAYFDDVDFVEIEKSEYVSATSSLNVTKFSYANEELEAVSANSNTKFAYSLKLENSYLANAGASLKADFTKSNTGATANKFADSSFNLSTAEASSPYGAKANVNKLTVKNTSATLTFDNFAKVDCGKYAFVSFYVKNQLSAFGSNNVSFNVYDMLSGKKDIITKDVVSITEISDEWQHVGFTIKNNFEKDNDSSTTGDVARSYKIEVVVGPTDVANISYKDEFATGEVYITSPLVATGSSYASIEDAKKADDLDNYNMFDLYSNVSDKTIALFAGFSEDYVAEEEHNHYAFKTAPSDLGSIITHPAVASGYQGIVADHIYVKEGVALETEINTRTTGKNGSYAGLINTKYNYSSILSDLNTALNFKPTEHEQSIQPLMIYNKIADNYGFIGNSNTIAKSSKAHISITLRVFGDDAIANIYLVNTTNKEKSVITFENFTDVDGKEHKGEDLQLNLSVTEDMMNYNGWVTVDFYIATGADAQDYRVEIWNGSRDAKTASQGYVFVKEVAISSSADVFSESERIEDTFTVSGNPLYREQIINGEKIDEIFAYKQKLTELENKFNSEQETSATKISYKENIVWAKNDTLIYAVYNTVNPVENNPYSAEENEEAVGGNCAAETDPSTFWLSLSSILLAAVLVLAIIMLIIKNVVRRRKANASDAKSHYTITSRATVLKDVKAKKAQKKEELEEVEEDEVKEDLTESVEESTEEQAEQTEEIKEESYVYGDVQTFGEEEKKD